MIPYGQKSQALVPPKSCVWLFAFTYLLFSFSHFSFFLLFVKFVDYFSVKLLQLFTCFIFINSSEN